jgi:hypothetical protein
MALALAGHIQKMKLGFTFVSAKLGKSRKNYRIRPIQKITGFYFAFVLEMAKLFSDLLRDKKTFTSLDQHHRS